ncbi:hypothetical protein [Hoyosella altamirensis]|uniref:Uncharacterized protein n=1 Tax=Hoyosella altamirensis TaxID=616997 RepID=A0A839RLR9_9ACTN|nr:hypothetical protein [Hoyosella altamirensis]MBB3037094.1 hypothetical protein [Hoyosella altamirensis]
MLQPIDEFAGFTKIGQFREAAIRYQLNALGSAGREVCATCVRPGAKYSP